MLDVDGKAEILAMARKMLRRKEKENIIDAAYSRYVFHDRHLPKWFEQDNDIYNRSLDATRDVTFVMAAAVI